MSVWRACIRKLNRTPPNVLVGLHTTILYRLRTCVQQYRATPVAAVRTAGDALYNIREGGGTFGKMQKAKEDEYFYKKTKSDIEKMYKSKDEQLKAVQELIKKHSGGVRHYETILNELKKDIEGLKKK